MSNERNELGKLLFTLPVSDRAADTAPEIMVLCDEAAEALLEEGYRKPRTITTIGNLAGLSAGTVIHTAHDRIFEYTGRNWISPGYPNDYAPIIDWLPATVIFEGVSK